MNVTRKDFLGLGLAGTAALATACARPQDTTSQPQTDPVAATRDLNRYAGLAIDMKAWHFDSENQVWWQLGLKYCLEPASKTYQQLAIFVPGPYMTGEQNGDTYSCKVADDGKVGSFTAKTAPVVMPVSPGDFSPQTPPVSYSFEGLKPYMDAGVVYVYAGMRGRTGGYESDGDTYFEGGAPWGVVDLKAAIRYLRYNMGSLPGDYARIVPFGFSSGGGICATLGASGNASGYEPYLTKIGAALYDASGHDISDAPHAVMCWNPMVSFDSAGAGYEWLLGQYVSEGPRAQGPWTALLSRDLAGAYGPYVNDMDLRDANGNHLALDETTGTVYADGSYYNHVLERLQDAAANFAASATFPYKADVTTQVNANFPGSGKSSRETDAVANALGNASAEATVSTVEGQTFETPADYFASLNSDHQWLTYNASRSTVRITDIGAFVTHCARPTRDVSAYDSIGDDRSINQLFGLPSAGSNSTLHFDAMAASCIDDHGESYAGAEGFDSSLSITWKAELERKDSLDVTTRSRVDLYNPLNYLSGHYGGFGTAAVAPHWRINAGVLDTECSLLMPINLERALAHYDGVKDVDFQLVWGQGHALCETSGDPIANFLSWVGKVCS